MSSDLQSALYSLSPDCPRDEWWRYLAALKTELGEEGKEVARQWSKDSDKYNPLDFESTWASLQPGFITAGTIIHATTGHVSNRPKPPLKVAPAAPQKDYFDYGKSLLSRASYADDYVSAHPYWQGKIGKLRDKGYQVQTSAFRAARGMAWGFKIGQRQDCLILPMRDFDDQLTGVECINAKGQKQTFAKRGAVHVMRLGNTTDKACSVYVCEGWATSVSALIAYTRDGGDILVVCAFGKQQMQKIVDFYEQQGRDPIRVNDGPKP